MALKPNAEILQQICEIQGKRIAAQDEMIEKLQASVDAMQEIIDNQNKIMETQAHMIEMLEKENKSLGGEITQ